MPLKFFMMNSGSNKRSRNSSRSYIAAFLLLITGFLALGCQDEKEEKVKATFEMQMENSKGEPVSMEDLKGKVIFFNVWATWCPPCIEEMPTIQNLYEEVGADPKIAFLMLSMDQDFDKAIQYREKYGYDFEIYRLTGAMPAMYSTKLIPTTFVIDPEGNLVLQHDGVGQFDTREFKDFILGLK